MFKRIWRKKRRKFPVKFDETGKSARRRCFEMFADRIPLYEIASLTDLKIDTVRRYHLQWKAEPEFENWFTYFKRALKNPGPDRERLVELSARACGVSREDFETILSKPHGLRRMMKGNINVPGRATENHKLSVVMVVAMAISDHLDRQGGQLDDVLFAFRKLMIENKLEREEAEQDIKENNRRMEFVHQILVAAAEQERQGRVQPDRLTEKERNAILKYGQDIYNKKLEGIYWLGIVTYLAEGLTEEQARERIYQDMVKDGKATSAEWLRRYQDYIHPLKKSARPPSSPPPDQPDNS